MGGEELDEGGRGASTRRGGGGKNINQLYTGF